MHTTRVIAHRGASGWAPEHTETAVRLAAALGADAVEPDLVATRDGVLVVRHDNELSETTDIASRPELADRRRTQAIDGVELTGWFVEDLTWPEVATLRARERLPQLRPLSARRDGRSACSSSSSTPPTTTRSGSRSTLCWRMRWRGPSGARPAG